MSLKFNGDLSTGDVSQWTSETAAAIGAIASASPMCTDNDYYYRITTPGTTHPEAYVSKTLSGGYRSFYTEFKFRTSLANVTNTSRQYRMINFSGTASVEFAVALSSDATGGQLDVIQCQYVNNTGSLATTLTAALPQSLIANNTAYTIKTFFKRSTGPAVLDGIIRVWIDDVLYIDQTALDIHPTNAITNVDFGLQLNTVTVAATVDLGCLKISTNGDVADQVTTYKVDPVNGSELNDGTESSPWAHLMQANTSAKAGDTVILAGDSSAPFRVRTSGYLDLQNVGAANNLITVRGNSRTSHTPLVGSLSFAPSLWTLDGNVEYSIDVSAYTANDPYRIYVCTEADFQYQGLDALDPRVVGNASVRNSVGTPGSLTAGQTAYSSGTIYYKPAAGETFAGLHIEIPCSTSTYTSCALMAQNYLMYKWIDAIFPSASGFIASANGTGSFIMECEGVSCSPNSGGLRLAASAATIYKCVGSWGVAGASSSGDGILCNSSGTGNIIVNTCHNNANDGIAFSGTHTASCIGNVCYNNGYEGQGDNSGIEVTATAVIKLYHNTCIGNTGAGIFNQSTVAAGQAITNNICAYNGIHGYSVSADHLTALMNNNASFGNNTHAFNLVGTGAVTPANTVTTDPLFTSASPSVGQQGTRAGENYTIGAASPCREITDGSAIVSRYWTTGPRPECQDTPVPDRRACMGAYQD